MNNNNQKRNKDKGKATDDSFLYWLIKNGKAQKRAQVVHKNAPKSLSKKWEKRGKKTPEKCLKMLCSGVNAA